MKFININISPLLALLLSYYTPAFALESNAKGSPQSLSTLMPGLCAGRDPSSCKVELDVPASCLDEGLTSNCPIVFHFHGSGGNIDGFKSNSGVHDYGVIGVYPQGDCKGWNTGPKDCNVCEWDDFDCPEDPDEGAFIAGIIYAIREMGADGNIYGIGNSNGAALAQRLAVNAGTELPFKGIVSKVTQLLESPSRSGPGVLNYNQPSPGGPKVSVLTICGTADGLIPYEGGPSGVFGGNDNFSLMSVDNSNIAWAAHNGCSTTPVITTVSASGGSGATSADLSSYTCPEAGVILESYKVYDAAHGAGSTTLDGKSSSEVAYDFIFRVEEGLGGSNPNPSPPSPTNPSPPAPSPPICEDDLTWSGHVSPDHGCSFIGENPGRRCSFVGADGRLASEACPVTCDTCSSNPPPPPPTPAPTTLPPSSCTDSMTWHGFYHETHTCALVKQDPENRCHWVGSDRVTVARDACPVACKTCP